MNNVNDILLHIKELEELLKTVQDPKIKKILQEDLKSFRAIKFLIEKYKE